MRLILSQKAILILSICAIFFQTKAQNYPLSDPTNAAGWIANTQLSDEFNGTQLDKTKWWVLGENGDYRSKWKGRAPGQFAPQNVKVINGDLILSSQWEPTFSFLNESQDGTPYGGVNKTYPITQACIMSERFFKYGYMEIRCKAAEAPVTVAFWTTGYHSEIDMVENYGKRPIANPKNQQLSLEKKYRTNLISWDPDRASTQQPLKLEKVLDVRVASDYYVYGFEWDKDYVKIYFNGTLINHFTRQQLEANDQWKYMYPQELWLDTEVFSWYGLPEMADLINAAEFKIDYVRIWQKEISNPNYNALGFEGPFYYQGRSSNWYSANTSPWRMKDEKAASGDLSLRFKSTGTFTGSQTMFSPNGAINLPSGDNVIKMKVWIDPTTTVSKVRAILRNPYKIININLTGVEKGKWVEVSQTFNRSQASATSIVDGDRLEIQIQAADVTSTNTLLYIDDISFQNNNNLAVNEFERNKINFKMHPNPSRDIVTIDSPDNGQIKISTILGVKVMEIEKNSPSTVIPVETLAKGVYFISLTTSKGSGTEKLIIE